ncbi:CPXCG motif-containing cysteine-rich protein [Flavobacteriaceae bacterium]|nr:CPXCG motif-containing cysteine-rich protein [Flavobacteriaceae bacterium]
MQEHFYQCPYCWEQVSVLVDVSQPSQTYIEDCEVCCNPIQFQIQCLGQVLQSLEAQSIEQ